MVLVWGGLFFVYFKWAQLFIIKFFLFIFGLIFCYLIEKSKKNLIFVYFIRIAVKPRGLARGYAIR